MESRGHRWPAGLQTNEGLQHELLRLCCFVEQFTLAMNCFAVVSKQEPEEPKMDL
jgi:hypothetical protein